MPRKYLVLIRLFLSITIQQLMSSYKKNNKLLHHKQQNFWKYKDFIFDILCPDLPEIHDNDRISFLRKRLKYIEVIWVNWPDRAKLKINIEVRRCKCLLSLAENTMPMIFYTDCIYKQEFRMVAPAENICLLIRKVLLSIMFNFLSTLKKLGNEVTFNF